jgi:hypothetical protein
MANEELKRIMSGLKPKCNSNKIKELDFIKEIRRDMLDAQKLHIEGDKLMGKVWEKLNKYIKENSLTKQ